MPGGAARVAVACLGLAACAGPPPAAPDRAAQAAACDREVAAHVGAPPEAVATLHRATAADGTATFEARDGDRLHLCVVDATGRVLRLDHPPDG